MHEEERTPNNRTRSALSMSKKVTERQEGRASRFTSNSWAGVSFSDVEHTQGLYTGKQAFGNAPVALKGGARPLRPSEDPSSFSEQFESLEQAPTPVGAGSSSPYLAFNQALTHWMLWDSLAEISSKQSWS